MKMALAGTLSLLLSACAGKEPAAQLRPDLRAASPALERYTQDDYYRFAAFFSRIRLQRKDPKDGPTILQVAGPDGKPARGPVGVVQPVSQVRVPALQPRPAQGLAQAGVQVDVATTDDNGPERLTVPLNEPVKEDGVKDFLWAMLMSPEFQFVN